MSDTARPDDPFPRALATGEAIERAVREHRGRDFPRWAALGLPVVDRGSHAIFPLASATTRTDAAGSPDGAGLAGLAERLYRHWGYWYGGHDYRVGRLASDEGYGLKLAEAGALTPGPYWWDVRDVGVVCVRSVDASPERETLALHVVPKSWVWTSQPDPTTDRGISHRRRTMRERAAADVTWEWPREE
ncbi:hypothetical protein [Isoptericola sp. NPDC057391]|uniref:hypothetical protein n=1 Tax=Isoptericola sp. NPDC057391 TaxID=3346117 RepID=UPI00362EF30A